MDNYVYALITYGDYEDTCYDFIKIHESEKEKFKQFCLDSQKIHGSYEESIELLYWAYNVENVDDKSYDVSIMTIHEYQERIKKCLNRLDNMKERHYLNNKRDLILKLLEYEWI